MLQLVCVIPCNLIIRKHGYKMKVGLQGGIGLRPEVTADKPALFPAKSRLAIVGEGIVIIAYVY